MTTKPNPDNRLSELARIDALNATTWPDRIARALRTMDDSQSPLHVSSGVPRSNDETMPEQSHDMRSARADRNQLIRLIVEREKLARGITRILNDWAPLTTKGRTGDTENSAIWCVNHLKHGEREPTDGRGRNCRWCSDWNRVLRSIGLGKDTWPNKEMIDLHARGIKVTETIARRALKGVA